MIERRVERTNVPHSPLFKIRAFSGGSIATLLSALSRGGLMFMLIIWLQGIWLPAARLQLQDTPLWAGIYMLPLSVGFLIAGPFAGRLADHFGARPFTTGGHDRRRADRISAAGRRCRSTSPTGIRVGDLPDRLRDGPVHRPEPDRDNEQPAPDQRGSGAGMAATFMNSASVLSIGVFFSLIIVGLSVDAACGPLPRPQRSRRSARVRREQVSHLPPVGSLFAAFLGYNPVGHAASPDLAHLPHATAAYLTGHRFFPTLVSHPFATGIHEAFYFAAACCLVAAVASWMRGGKYYYTADVAEVEEAELLEVI